MIGKYYVLPVSRPLAFASLVSRCFTSPLQPPPWHHVCQHPLLFLLPFSLFSLYPVSPSFFFFNILFLIFKALRYRGALLPCWCDAGLHHPFAWLSCGPPWLQFHVLLKRVCEAASFSSKLFFKIPQLPQRAGIHTC